MKRFSWYVLAFVVMAIAAGDAQGPPNCLPVASPTPKVDGIVATDPFCIASGGCDAAWAGAPYSFFQIIGGGPSTNAAIFVSSKLTAGRPDDLFLGVHLENVDQLSVSDVVTLYFDTNDDGVPEFALQYEVGPVTPILSGTETSGTLQPHTVTYFTFMGGNYVQQTTPAEPTLVSRVAYNLPGGGAPGIWELELHVNINNPSVNFPATMGKIRFGAKLYTKASGGAQIAYDWPNGLTTDAAFIDHAPGSGSGGDPLTLDRRNVSASCQGDVQAVQLSSSSSLGPNTFHRPTTDGSALPNGTADPLPPDLQTTFSAAAQYINTGDALDTSPLGGPNQGFIHFFIRPWGMGPVATIEMLPPASVNINQFGTPFPGTVTWPIHPSDWNNNADSFKNGSSDHACFEVKLEGFPSDSTLASPGVNDDQQINLSYSHASTIHDKVLIHALGTPSPGAPKENYALHVRWDNVPVSQVKQPGEDKRCWLRRLCDRLHHRTYWQTQFVNGDNLGIKPLKQPGYYGLQLAPGEEVALDVALTGAVMPAPSKSVHIAPGAGGQVLSPASGSAAVSVPIPAGGTVTVVAHDGVISVSGPNETAVNFGSHNANGFAQPAFKGKTFLLASRAFEPWVRTGALIGAFKADFSDSFFIGTANTFFAPPGAATLFLAVNDVAGQYGDNSGPGFDVNVIATPPPTLPTKLSQPANPKLGLPAIAEPAANLPMLVMDLVKVDPVKNVAIPVGYVAYAIYDSDNGKTQKGGTGTPLVQSGQAAATHK